jgi:hypothetical protein
MLNYFMRIVAPPNSQVLSITNSIKQNMASSLKTILSVRSSSSSLERKSQKMCDKLVCLGQLHVATTDNCNFQILNVSAEFGALLSVNESCSNFIHLRFSDWSSPRVYLFTNVGSLIQQFIPLVNQYYFWWFPSKHHMKSPLHCSCKPTHTTTCIYLSLLEALFL